jgi:predicted CopG family antitoxin
MRKRMTITMDEAVYEGLYRTVGKRRMSQFIENLLRPHVLDTSLDDGYRAMATDKARESEAAEWCNAIV